jgi:hypothetical protein
MTTSSASRLARRQARKQSAHKAAVLTQAAGLLVLRSMSDLNVTGGNR